MEPLDDDHRFRCAACGNLTRFNVVERRRAARFYHFSLAGDLSIEEEDVLEAVLERVECRWCSSTDIEVVPRAGQEPAEPTSPQGSGGP